MLNLPHEQAFAYYKDFLHWYCNWHQPSFLEVGCLGGDLCMSLKTPRSLGIDINEHPDWPVYTERSAGRVSFLQMSSDEYFDTHNDRFGLIFIDGDHHVEQVLRDVHHALFHLEAGGVIALHDTFPPTIGDTAENLCGSAYKAAIVLRQRKDLEVFTFTVTYGLTLVRPIGRGFPWAM